MSKALYRKYRSTSLADVVGQNHITDILTRALKADRVSHAYLFTGPRGVGKTSIARILAHEINQLTYNEESNHLDIIEIDAASNNGVEDVRDLREKVQIAPVSARKKVYIIDEVHMLSKPAFNALLKTLEEPPEHVVFILATTDVEKLPATIISRTQRYGFRAISSTDAVKHLKHIASQENIAIDDEALALIAERGDGSFRDSISLLDQLASLADDGQTISADLIETTLGLAPKATIEALLAAVDKHDVAQVAQLLAKSEADGISPVVLTEQLTKTLREKAVEKPHVLSLLDALLDVARSTQPSIKLLSVLGTAAYDHKPKTAALVAPPLEVSATIQELSEQATKKHPHVEAPAATPVAPAPAPIKTEAKKSAAEPVLDKPLTAVINNDIAYDWANVIEHCRENAIALYSVLTKCGHHLDGTKLTIYCQNAFYKKKLDDPRYSSQLYEALAANGGHLYTVETVPTRAPMKDSQAEAIADIMGGGIEITPEAA